MIACMSLFAAETVKVGHLYYSLESTSATVIKDQSGTGQNYPELTVADIPAYVSYGGHDYKVTTISSSAFNNCPELVEVTIPTTVTSVGSQAFNNCIWLERVNWNAVSAGSPSSYSYRPFTGCGKINTVKFGGQVTAIPAYVCYEMSELTSLTISASVKTIGKAAFCYCTGLTNVVLPDGLTSVGTYAFSNCGNLESINIPSTLTSVNDYFCYRCYKLTGVVLPEGLTSIGEYAFQETAITSITIPSTVTGFGDAPFRDCKSLTSVVWKPVNISGTNFSATTHPFYMTSSSYANISSFTFADNVQSIPAYICYEMYKLAEIEIPSTVKKIGKAAFCYCTGLTNVVLPDGLTSVGTYAFSNCGNLESINIPSTLTAVSSNFCYRCLKLTGVVLPEGVTSIGDYAFQETAITSITVPSTVTGFGDAPFRDCGKLLSVVWKPVNISGTNFSTNTNPFYTTSSSYANITSFTFADNVQSIPAYICFDMSKLTSVTIPATVTKIGRNAFSYCTGLTEMVLPERVTSVGTSAFSNCVNLESVNIPSALTAVSSYFCYRCLKLTGVEIPEGVTSIGDDAFQETAITSITIPATVTSLGDAPFYNCKSLATVLWKAVNTTCGNATNTHPFYGCSALKNLTFSGSVTNIPNYAFYDASSLEKIVNYALVPQTVNANVFKSVNKETCELCVPEGAMDVYAAKDVWKDFFRQEKAPAVTSEFSETACDKYVWDDETLATSGDHVKKFVTALGQDSIVTLHLTVNHSTVGEETREAVDSYEWHDGIHTESGDYQYTFANAAGCDSVVTLHLTVTLSPVYKEISEVACDRYEWNGKTYTVSQDIVETFHTAAGRDSIVTLHLTVNHSTVGEETREAVDSYEWHDGIHTESGDYQYTFANAAGCDSVVTLHLTVTPVWKVTLSQPEHGTVALVETGIDMDKVTDLTVLHFTATPDEGYMFDAWQGCEADGSLTVTRDVAVTCSFVPDIPAGADTGKGVPLSGQARKVVRNGQLLLILPDGRQVSALGMEIENNR